MGGAVMVFIALWERAYPGRVMDKRMYFSVVVGAFLFGAFFLAWRDKQHAFVSVSKQLATAIDDKKPKFTFKLDSSFLMPYPAHIHPKAPLYLLGHQSLIQVHRL